MFTSSRRFAVALAGGALLVGGSARAQDESPPMFNTPPSTFNASPPVLNPPPPDLGPPAYRPHPKQANTGLQVGVRTGYGGGSGIVYSGLSVREASGGGIPVILDLGVRALPQLYAGIYGSWSEIFTKNNPVSCPGDLDCKTDQWRFGVELDIHTMPRSKFDPYFGIGSGYEILHTTINGTMNLPTPLGSFPGQVSAGIIDRGWEFVNLTGGFDWRINSGVGIGPFISGSLSEYGVHDGIQSASLNGTQVANMPVPRVTHGLHELYFAGIRGTFNP
jgi:hypothetical protein